PLAELFGHRLEELPGDLRIALDERAEVPRRHAVAVQVARRGDRGSAIRSRQERDLAEVVARADLPALLAVDADLRRAALDDEETRTACALLRHGLPGRERP